MQLAVDSAGANCVRGYGSFCCDPPVNTLAGRSDPQMQDFQRYAHAFMLYGTCSVNGGGAIPRKRQLSSLLNPGSHDMALKLGPLLYDWVWSSSERQYLTPFQQIWDDEVSATGNVFPKFDALANGLVDYNPIEGSSIDYLDNILCYGKVGADAISGAKATSSHLCVVIGGGARKRGEVIEFAPRQHAQVRSDLGAFNKTHSNIKRWFFDNWSGDPATKAPYNPTTGNAFDLLANGVLRPEFYNFFRYQNNEIEMESKQNTLAETARFVSH